MVNEENERQWFILSMFVIIMFVIARSLQVLLIPWMQRSSVWYETGIMAVTCCLVFTLLTAAFLSG